MFTKMKHPCKESNQTNKQTYRKVCVTKIQGLLKDFSNVYGFQGLQVNEPGPEDIKLFSCSTQLSMKFQLLIKAKIPTKKRSIML